MKIHLVKTVSDCQVTLTVLPDGTLKITVIEPDGHKADAYLIVEETKELIELLAGKA